MPTHTTNQVTATRKFNRGRGSNPISRNNLTGPKRDTYVYEQGSGIGWSQIAGPMTYREAYAAAAKLESMNRSTCKPMYVASGGI